MEFKNQVKEFGKKAIQQTFKCGCIRLILPDKREIWFIECDEHSKIYKREYMTVTLELKELITGDFCK